MEKIKYRNIRVEIDGCTHEVTLVFKRDAFTVAPARFKAGENLEEFPVKIVGEPDGAGGADFYYKEARIHGKG